MKNSLKIFMPFLLAILIFSFSSENRREIFFKIIGGNTGYIILKTLTQSDIIFDYADEEKKLSLFTSFLINYWPFIVIVLLFYSHWIQFFKDFIDEVPIHTTYKADDNNIFKKSKIPFKSYDMYEIGLHPSEVHIVEKAILMVKNKHNDQIKTKRSGEHISLICCKFIENEKKNE